MVSRSFLLSSPCRDERKLLCAVAGESPLQSEAPCGLQCQPTRLKCAYLSTRRPPRETH